MNEFLRHEALHTTYLIHDMVEGHLVEHHYYHSGCNRRYNELIDKARQALWEAYQVCNEENETKSTN